MGSNRTPFPFLVNGQQHPAVKSGTHFIHPIYPLVTPFPSLLFFLILFIIIITILSSMYWYSSDYKGVDEIPPGNLQATCYYAAREGNVELVKSILERKPEDLSIQWVMGGAIEENHIDIVDLCLLHGATISEPIMRHVRSMEMLKHLMERKGGKIEHLETTLRTLIPWSQYSYGEKEMRLVRKIFDYAYENSVILDWDRILGNISGTD